MSTDRENHKYCRQYSTITSRFAFCDFSNPNGTPIVDTISQFSLETCFFTKHKRGIEEMCYLENIWGCLCCCCPSRCLQRHGDDDASFEAQDASASGLSYVGQAAYDVLRTKHSRHHHALWNVTSATVVGSLLQTPRGGFPRNGDPEKGQDDWFPQKICDIMSKTTVWCDVMSLEPPDGLFLTKVREALACIADRSKESDTTIIIRMMFGNIIGSPVNCDKVIKELTKDLPQDANIRLWVGAWRKGSSWNHAKIIAVDGRYLHIGGHNMYHHHYLDSNPIHDVSIELEGRVAHGGHGFANQQWEYIKRIQTTCCGRGVHKLPDSWLIPGMTRVTHSEYPRNKAHILPPSYNWQLVEPYERLETDVLIIGVGRLGSLYRRARPSDDAIAAMLGSAKTVIHMALQDLGPVCIAGTKIPLPGCPWPEKYLSALGHVIWEKGVVLEIILSNPRSTPGGPDAPKVCYSNGWSAEDVAAEIIKRIRVRYPKATDAELRHTIASKLRVCFVSINRPVLNKYTSSNSCACSNSVCS